MHCPFCGDLDTKVIDSRLVAEGDSVRRRRECLSCGERFTTFETAELVMPHLIKRDGRREPFDEEKLRYGLSKALEKRPVSVDEIETSVNHIKHKLRSTGERELPALRVGEAVMAELRALDPVAYVRFASVYRDFQDVSEFADEINKLASTRKPVTRERWCHETSSDVLFVKSSLELAALGRNSCAPNPPVGCIIVRDGRVIGRGYHRRRTRSC